MMMDFDEPDLEELIQHDLHSEMNKILDESNTDSHTSQKVVMSVNAVLPESPHIHEEASPASTKKNFCTPGPVSNGSQTPENDDISEIQVTNVHSCNEEANGVFAYDSQSLEVAVKSEILPTDFSGHFSVERFPTSSVEEHMAMECLVQKSEQSDLSNLAWLTTVDVQQALQRDGGLDLAVESGAAVSLSQQLCANPVETAFPSTTSVLPPSGFSPQAVGKAPSSTGGLENMQTTYRLQTRFTPIQPHPNQDHAHQRYMIHGGNQSGVHHRTLLPMSERPGPHRFTHHGGHQSGYHPYPPPPPYGAAYNHEGYHYNRPPGGNQKIYPKPVYSYSCLIAMSLQKSKTGCLPVSDIYSFMMENFPYFKTAPDGWKNSVRHNLSLNKCFEKVEKPNGTQRKGCLWALNPAKANKMEEEVQKWKRKDPEAIRRSMSHPDDFDREMEELRRADEEAARRRMLSLSSHGLSMATPPSHNFHPGFPLHRAPGHDTGQGRPHMHPSGSVSMPTTPQHHSPQAGTYRLPMTPVQRTHSTNANTYGHAGNHFSHPPRQLFQFPTEPPHSLSIGIPEVTSTPVVKTLNNFAKSLPQLSSPNSSSSTSSGTCAAFFGSIADTLSATGPDLNDLDLDSSLADLSALQVPFWDETAGTATPQGGASDPLLSSDVFDETDGQRSATQGDPLTPSFHVMGQSTHRGGDPSGPDVFPSRFGGDLSYLASTGNNKPVMLH